MPIQIGQKRQADFDDPLGMLSDCHRRIENFLAILGRLARQFRGTALADPERKALESALEYFRHSGPRHTADEEDSLFPRMRSCEAAAAALATIDSLHAEHLVADRAHAEVETLGSRWLNEGRLDEGDSARLVELLESLEKMYARHIALEDRELFPTAGQALTPAEIVAIGEEMARRRGLR